MLGAVAEARRLGAKTISITCTPDSELARAVDIAIQPLPGPEIVAGSTRMKAGTAAKMALGLLSTAAMIRLGKVREGRMIDFRPSNDKLRRRAARMVAELAQVSETRARAALMRSRWNVRAALQLLETAP